METAELEPIDPIYLPFSPADLRPHLLVDTEGHLKYFQDSAERYHHFCNSNEDQNGIPIGKAQLPCQIQKDERFWTVAALKALYDAPNRTEAFASILTQEFGPIPPVGRFDNWTECLNGPLRLIFEGVLPSPESYVSWLRENLSTHQLIPYIINAANRTNNRTLEGPTHVDAIIINEQNGFSLLIEAKVLSDISHGVSFDVFRNQLARNLDILLEPCDRLCDPLKRRRPELSLFLLLTPERFKEKRHSRLYGWLFEEYKRNPDSMGRDLPHRKDTDWEELSHRMGWLTFEQINGAVPGACPWL